MRAFIYIMFLLASIVVSANESRQGQKYATADVNIQKLFRGPSGQQKTEQCDKMSRRPSLKMSGRTATAKPHQYTDRNVNK